MDTLQCQAPVFPRLSISRGGLREKRDTGLQAPLFSRRFHYSISIFLKRSALAGVPAFFVGRWIGMPAEVMLALALGAAALGCLGHLGTSFRVARGVGDTLLLEDVEYYLVESRSDQATG